MIVGSKISCIGIVGEGCGGGREFIVEDGILSAYDPQSGERVVLLKNIQNAYKIHKKECLITIECIDEIVKFNLSKLQKV